MKSWLCKQDEHYICFTSREVARRDMLRYNWTPSDYEKDAAINCTCNCHEGELVDRKIMGYK